MTPRRSIVCIVPDLFFAVKIENLARDRGLAVRQPRDLAAFKSALSDAALVLIDAGTQHLPWAEWVAAAKSEPLTQRVPILAFGSHVDATLRSRALSAGADRYLARSSFVEGLPEIIARAARDVRADPCGEPLPDSVQRGIEEFNAGQYFEQHETLELVWRAEDRAVRDLYRGILQIGLAFLQIERGNAAGAIKMFERAFRWLEPFRPACQGVDVERLVRESREVYAEVQRLGARRIREIDSSAFPHVHLLSRPDNTTGRRDAMAE
ncbi:MAG TPA: DUF309 domain-containing protein [Anaerolineae bacterium]|nr:DUF309 domain-containing protein [Anaerolineae bacterium]